MLLPASVLSSTDAACQCLRRPRAGALLARLDGATATTNHNQCYIQPITIHYIINQLCVACL